jgi:hypothetical protein
MIGNMPLQMVYLCYNMNKNISGISIPRMPEGTIIK